MAGAGFKTQSAFLLFMAMIITRRFLIVVGVMIMIAVGTATWLLYSITQNRGINSINLQVAGCENNTISLHNAGSLLISNVQFKVLDDNLTFTGVQTQATFLQPGDLKTYFLVNSTNKSQALSLIPDKIYFLTDNKQQIKFQCSVPA